MIVLYQPGIEKNNSLVIWLLWRHFKYATNGRSKLLPCNEDSFCSFRCSEKQSSRWQFVGYTSRSLEYAMGWEVISHDPLIVANYFYKGKHESGLKIFLAQTQQNTPKSVSLRRLWHAVYSNSPEKQEALWASHHQPGSSSSPLLLELLVHTAHINHAKSRQDYLVMAQTPSYKFK